MSYYAPVGADSLFCLFPPAGAGGYSYLALAELSMNMLITSESHENQTDTKYYQR
jgi:hypothetical protein